MEIIRLENEVIVKIKEENGKVYKIGLGNSTNLTDEEIEVIADKRLEEIKFAELNPPAPSYTELRRAEYPSADELVVALWEAVIEGRPTTAADLQAKREAIKAKYPKK